MEANLVTSYDHAGIDVPALAGHHQQGHTQECLSDNEDSSYPGTIQPFVPTLLHLPISSSPAPFPGHQQHLYMDESWSPALLSGHQQQSDDDSGNGDLPPLIPTQHFVQSSSDDDSSSFGMPMPGLAYRRPNGHTSSDNNSSSSGMPELVYHHPDRSADEDTSSDYESSTFGMPGLADEETVLTTGTNSILDSSDESTASINNGLQFVD